MVRFSIIIPVYNVKPYLQQCVDSVLNQTYREFELLLIDDGSTDGSGEICDQYAERDRRVRVIHQLNRGQANARNTGLANASGEYIAFLDSDDYWDRSDALMMMNAEIENSCPDMLLIKFRKFFQNSGEFEEVNGNIKLQGKDYDDQLRHCVEVQLYDACAWNKVFNAKLNMDSKLGFTEGIVAEDIDWPARLCLVASSLAVLETPIHVYRKGRAGASTSSLKYKNLIDTKESIERCLAYVRDRKLSLEMKEAYYGYVAYRYVIWLAEYEAILDERKKYLLKEMLGLKWLLKYSVNRKVYLVRKVTAVLGIRLTMKLLKLYLRKKV